MSILSANFNPFANIDLHVPKAYHDLVSELSSSDGLNEELGGPPFRRMVDVWAFACSLGAAEKLFVNFERPKQHKFHTGQVLQGDIARIEFMLSLAIGYTGDPYIVSNANEVVKIADAYAAGGLTLLEDYLLGSDSRASNIATNLLKRFFTNQMQEHSDQNLT
jgi:hypothetical protein